MTTIETLKDKLIQDLNNIIHEAEQLLNNTDHQASDSFNSAKEKFTSTLKSTKEQLAKFDDISIEKVKETVKMTDAYVKQHTWESIGIAAGVGVLIGLLISRK